MFVDDKWVGQFRHVLTTLGGVLVALGYFTGDDVASWLNGYDQVAGPAFVFVGQIWSWLVKT